MSPNQLKAVKNEVKDEEEDDDDIPLSSSLKAKKETSNMNGGREARLKLAAKVKKEGPKLEDESEDNEDSKAAIKKVMKKIDKDRKMIKKIKVKEEAVNLGKKNKSASAAAKEKKEKKVYSLPGQRLDPPEERDPLRIFYETLYQQLPSSEMAPVWMMERGLLPLDKAKKLYEQRLKMKQQQKLGSPAKPVPVKRTTKEASVKRIDAPKSSSKELKKRKAGSDSGSDDDDDDFTPIKKKLKK